MINKQSLSEWHPVGPGTPLHAWLETKRDGEEGFNVCSARIMFIGDDVEWVEKETGRTTITHHSFAAPTHWRWPDMQGKPVELEI